MTKKITVHCLAGPTEFCRYHDTCDSKTAVLVRGDGARGLSFWTCPHLNNLPYSAIEKYEDIDMKKTSLISIRTFWEGGVK